MTDAEKIAEKHNADVRAKAGHNSAPKLEEYAKRLNGFLDVKEANAEDIRELKKEAKEQAGINPQALSAAVKLQRETAEQREKRQAFEQVVDEYRNIFGILD